MTEDQDNRQNQIFALAACAILAAAVFTALGIEPARVAVIPALAAGVQSCAFAGWKRKCRGAILKPPTTAWK